MDRHWSPPAVDLQAVVILTPDELLQPQGPAIAADGFSRDSSACDFATVDSGRMLRAHIRSFLI